MPCCSLLAFRCALLCASHEDRRHRSGPCPNRPHPRHHGAVAGTFSSAALHGRGTSVLFPALSPYASLAGRFAVKEAILKALGTGWSAGVRWSDIQVLNDSAGRPVATVHGRVGALVREAGVTGIHVSLSHDAEYAIAEAVLTS